VYYGVGYGKTILATSIADHYRKFDRNRKIVVLLSKSLQGNFENNIRKFMKNNPQNEGVEKSEDFISDVIETRYKFISLNASNMYTQISKIGRIDEELELEKRLGEFNTSIANGFLENSLLIIDEFHNLSNSITNGSGNAIKLYHTIMNTKNIKLVFLTGTPIINHPFELVPTFNMLKGYMIESPRDVSKKITLFPESFQEFEKFFINNDNGTKGIKNKERLQNRMIGMVSYYGDMYANEESKKKFPEQKPIIVETVPMSLFQFARYQEMREVELKEESRKSSKPTGSFVSKEQSKSSSSYRIRSRQVSNFYIPEYALTFMKSRTNVTKFINKIKPNDLQDLDKHSPKFKRLLDNISKHEGQLGAVYSEFVHGEGLALLAKALEANLGYKMWDRPLTENASDKIELIVEEKAKPKDTKKKGGRHMQKTYALLTGDVPFLERKNILKVFNQANNADGSIISLLLFSKSGVEGMNLYRVRHIHVMEPFWNFARIEQAIARGNRYMSHMDLPPKDRNIQPYIYISTYPDNYRGVKKERTTDEEIWLSANAGKKLRDEFELAMVEASIDCSVNSHNLSKDLADKVKCYLCAPTNERLYEFDLYQDVSKPNPCSRLAKNIGKEVKAKEIKVKIDDTEKSFYYTKTDQQIKVFEHSDELGGYIPLKPSHPLYGDIVRKILAL
jgi:hypothetical protein